MTCQSGVSNNMRTPHSRQWSWRKERIVGVWIWEKSISLRSLSLILLCVLAWGVLIRRNLSNDLLLWLRIVCDLFLDKFSEFCQNSLIFLWYVYGVFLFDKIIEDCEIWWHVNNFLGNRGKVHQPWTFLLFCDLYGQLVLMMWKFDCKVEGLICGSHISKFSDCIILLGPVLIHLEDQIVFAFRFFLLICLRKYAPHLLLHGYTVQN